MTLPDRNNPYSFDAFLDNLHGFDFYRDDPFLQQALKHYAGDDWPEIDRRMKTFSPKVSFRWRPMADYVARPELRPRLEQYDAHNRRVDRLHRPAETKALEKDIFGEGLFSQSTLAWENFGKRFLLYQLGEFGVMCPVTCTEGLIALMEQYPDHGLPEVDRILKHCKEGLDGDFGLGAQFVSEIQGGSDIPANLLEAVPDGDLYRLYGYKFFCSAIHADYAVVTAKITGSESVGAFIVPAWLPGNKEKEIRNGYRINRIKWKMGTAELPTAEVEYDGALAYPIGPTDRGVANVAGIVLTLSRITVGIGSASGMTRAAREAFLYSEFRDVFGQKICQHPLAAHQIKGLVEAARRTTAGAFKIYDHFLRLGRKLTPGLPMNGAMDRRRRQFNLRELIIMQKLVSAYDAVDVSRKAISIFGGHGVIEDFLSLPRTYRDGAVNELWEGPRNVLLIQIFRDLHRVRDWYPPREFVAEILDGVDKDQVDEMARALEDFLDNPPFFEVTPETMQRAADWDAFIDTIFAAYQESALNEIGRIPIVNEERIAFPEIWAEAPELFTGRPMFGRAFG